MIKTIEFKYINDSLTTALQNRFIGKVASYFDISKKLLRSTLDEEMIKKHSLIHFSNPLETFGVMLRDNFYISSFKLSVHDLITPSKFINSRFYSEYTIMISDPERGGNTVFVVDSEGQLFCLIGFDKLPKDVDVGGVYMSYNSTFKSKILLPIETFFSARYPSPVAKLP